jgi:restriction system protein
MNYQRQQAEKRQRQQAAAASRAHAAALRQAERARREAERAATAAKRASAAEQKARDAEAKRRHIEAREAEAAAMNAELQQRYAEIDGLLDATLGVDDHVDLETLKITSVEHPPFDPGQLGTPTPPMPQLVYPPEPVYQEPPAPGALSAAFGGRKRHEEAVARARSEYEAMWRAWRDHCQRMEADYRAESERRHAAEAVRLDSLAKAEAEYAEQCRAREAEAAEHNQRVDKFINDLAFDVETAIEEYVGVVLANSVYPESFPVEHDYDFDLGTRELTLTVTVPQPSSVPTVKEYRYVKAKDEIVPSTLTVKASKDRYANAVWQVALRTLHEVFEADRAGKIHTVSLTVATNTISASTGLAEQVPLAVVAADRDTFTQFDLSNVVPEATLKHLGAALSKSPIDLVPADTGAGVRTRGR